MDKTYAESQGKPAFDWNLFLDRAEKEQIKPSEWRKAERLASCWVTCACGNQCAAIPRNIVGAPIDDKLDSHGMGFYSAIARQCVTEARYYLKEIENRSAEILSEIFKQPCVQEN